MPIILLALSLLAFVVFATLPESTRVERLRWYEQGLQDGYGDGFRAAAILLTRDDDDDEPPPANVVPFAPSAPELGATANREVA